MAGKFRPEEISSVIKERIRGFDLGVRLEHVGVVMSYSDGVARVHGLSDVMYYELVEFDTDDKGLALSLESWGISVVVLGTGRSIKEGTRVRSTHRLMNVPVGDGVIGRVISALGEPLDGKGAVDASEFRPVERKAPGIMDRKSVHEPLQTGIKAIDALVPIGRGQRELIIGDRQTGKTTIAIDSIINQKGKDVICVYVAIGQKANAVAQVVRKLEENGAMAYTVVVSATAGTSAAMQYLAPYVGATVGEYFRDTKRHALVVYDDLTKHAVAYREMSLILRRPPGREAFPGDVFYVHSRLLERAAKLSDDLGAGSLTALPIIETQAGDVSAYIPTNVISITDGQIFLETGLFYSGVRPAINVGLSVSRVGGAAQIKAMKQVSWSLRLDLAQFRELQAFSQFASDLDDNSRKLLERGRRIVELLKQEPYSVLGVEYQVVILYAGVNGFLDSIPAQDVARFESDLYAFMTSKHPYIFESIRTDKQLCSSLESTLSGVLEEFSSQFSSRCLNG